MVVIVVVEDEPDVRAAIVRDLQLRHLPSLSEGGFYRRLSVYGHMGRTDLKAPWERTDKASQLD